jgi:predicted branched-subunit amino acid permease
MAGLSVIAAQGSYMEMALVQFVINLRYLLMSAALSQKAEPSLPTRHRLLIAYGVTDEIFGVSVLKEGALHPFYSYGLIGISALGWVAGTVTAPRPGAFCRPYHFRSGLALYGMFTASMSCRAFGTQASLCSSCSSCHQYASDVPPFDTAAFRRRTDCPYHCLCVCCLRRFVASGRKWK